MRSVTLLLIDAGGIIETHFTLQNLTSILANVGSRQSTGVFNSEGTGVFNSELARLMNSVERKMLLRHQACRGSHRTPAFSGLIQNSVSTVYHTLQFLTI